MRAPSKGRESILGPPTQSQIGLEMILKLGHFISPQSTPLHYFCADTIDPAPGPCSAPKLPTWKPLDPLPSTRKETNKSISDFLSVLSRKMYFSSPHYAQRLIILGGWTFAVQVNWLQPHPVSLGLFLTETENN